jgi:hypothetical protein
LAAVLLLLPLADVWPRTELALFRWERLRGASREPPGSDVDRAYRALAPHLPAQGVIGFRRVTRRGRQADATSQEAGEQRFRAQYALAPRRVVDYTNEDYLVEYGPADSAQSAGHDPQFTLLAVANEDARAYRRLP